MKNNLYWNVYQNLERELIEISNIIHVDDKQLKVYSTKIADLLTRTSIEVEAISKELYFREGGTKGNDNKLYFDTDCLKLLEDRWHITQKVVKISSPFLYVQEDNCILKPLKNANKRGKSAWLKAYQAVKHNRIQNLKQGNLQNFISALASLFLLNIYYRSQTFDLKSDRNGTTFDESFGSSFFSICTHPFLSIPVSENTYTKASDFDECTYLIQATDEKRKTVQKILTEIEIDVYKDAVEKARRDFNVIGSERAKDKFLSLFKENVDSARQEVYNRRGRELACAFKDLDFEAVLNTNQY